MKRILLSLLAVAGLLTTSCQKTNETADGNSELSNVTLSVAMDCVSSTRSAVTDFGSGSNINRCVLEVYTYGRLYKRMYAKVEGGVASFNINLVNSLDYDIVAWADYDNDEDLTTDNYYITNGELGLMDISYSDSYQEQFGPDEFATGDYSQFASQPNNDKMDAFSGSRLDYNISGDETIKMVLTRPFGQLSFTTQLTDVPSYLVPEYICREIADTKVYNRFNALSGDVVAMDSSIAGTEIGLYDLFALTAPVAGESVWHLSTEYLFAPKSGELLVDTKLSFRDGGEAEINNRTISNIPIKRNYRTIVSGELLTVDGHIDIEIDNMFTGNLITDLASQLSDLTIEDNTSIFIADETITAGELNALNTLISGTAGVKEVTLSFEGTTEINNGSENGKGSGCFGSTVKYNISSTTMTTVGNSVFENAVLGDVYLPNVETVEKQAFMNTTADVIRLDKATTIKTEAFRDAKIKEIYLDAVTAVGADADIFAGENNTIEHISMASLKSITRALFYNKKSLKSVYLPNVETIYSSSVFAYCESLAIISLPKLNYIKALQYPFGYWHNSAISAGSAVKVTTLELATDTADADLSIQSDVFKGLDLSLIDLTTATGTVDENNNWTLKDGVTTFGPFKSAARN